jgi:SAM-dependent methyltransferase
MRPGVEHYERHGRDYAATRATDPRIAARIHAALGDARTVVNVGAGSGSYEPTDRHVMAIEPSAAMRAQRPRHLAPAIDAVAEALPLDDDAVDAAMAVITIQHWADQAAGLGELRRVARGPVVVVTFDPDRFGDHWLMEYVPEALADDRARFPTVDFVVETLGGARVEPVPIPADCRDGFLEAFYARPEAFLDESVRRSQSIWPRLPPGVEDRAIAALAADLESGRWDERHGHLRTTPEYHGALRLVVGER